MVMSAFARNHNSLGSDFDSSFSQISLATFPSRLPIMCKSHSIYYTICNSVTMSTWSVKAFYGLYNDRREFGPGSEFGFEKPLQVFGLLPAAPEPTPTRFGIRSVSVSLPYPARKTRYLSSAYCVSSALSEPLIIGRSKTVGRCRSSPSGPTIFDKNHRVIDRYTLRLWVGICPGSADL